MPPRKPVEQAEEETTQTGDGGAREAEVSAAQVQYDEMKLTVGDAPGNFVKGLTSVMIEMVKHLPRPWGQMGKSEQQDLIRGTEYHAHELVRELVEGIASSGTDPVRCLFVGFTDKGDDIKAELKLKAASKDETETAVMFFHRARGRHVLLTLASADEFHQSAAADISEEDQRTLGFEAGTDEHPDDDSDLADPGGDQAALRHDDAVAFAGSSGRCRIDLKRGWIQFLEDGEVDHDASWQDMREATPAELAAERERTADFAVDEEEAVTA